MKTPTHSSIRVSLEMGMIAFFILAALSLLVVYLADPAIYAHSLSLTSSPADRYPVLVITSKYDGLVDSSHAMYVQSHVPQAQLFLSEAESHLMWFSTHDHEIQARIRLSLQS